MKNSDLPRNKYIKIVIINERYCIIQKSIGGALMRKKKKVVNSKMD